MRGQIKVAVVGGGAAAVGVLRALEEWAPAADVTMIDHPPKPSGPFERATPPDTWTMDDLRSFHRHLRQDYGLKFPPPKTHFGVGPADQEVEGWGRIWASRERGGLTRYWGASTLPFTDHELKRWPLGAVDLAPYYRRIADLIGIAGRRDALNRYFSEDFVSRPPIRLTALMEAFERTLGGERTADGFTFLGGIGRLAVETRLGHADRCVHCGHCMTGCFTDAVYSSRRDVDRLVTKGVIRQRIDCQVRSFDLKTRTIRLDRDAEPVQLGPFDRIYLCAGCVGTTEITMRSLGLFEGPVMVDNTIYTFPILRLGSPLPERLHTERDLYFALTNLLIACVPSDARSHPAMIQIYPSFDYLWRYFMPVALWPALQPFGRSIRRRVLIARLYVHGAYSQHYAFRIDPAGRLRLHLAKPPPPLQDLFGLWPAIRQVLSRQGFVVPKLKPAQARTSSHYAASLPLAGALVEPTGEIAPGVFVCDSSVFPDGPAVSPTLTIMANACRTAHQSL